jgi:phage terminase small subunit
MFGKITKGVDKMPDVRNYPPKSINTIEKHEMYLQLHDDINSCGKKIEWVDRHALADLAVMIIERNHLVKELEEKGEGYKSQGDRNIIERKNPARTALEKLRPQILTLMREFKMTPASRKVEFSGFTGQEKSDGFEDI